jgi:7 transmembrane sweet-taste receptor of 3 GCPR
MQSFSQVIPFFRPVVVEAGRLDPRTKLWTQRNPFIYADGTTTPPPLRDEAEQNYLSPSARAVGLTLMTVALLFIFFCAVWVACHRNHSVVIAAQPVLLYTLCLGSTMIALVILLQSYDESYVKDQDMLDKVCIANVWFDALGHTIALSAVSFPEARSALCFPSLQRLSFFPRRSSSPK